MNRRYNSARFLDTVARVREWFDRPGITTDVIVGFPGETDAEFAETVRVCEAARFSRMHIFPFSARPGTPAASMLGVPPPPVVADRKARLDERAASLADHFRRQFVGETLPVLVETTRDRSGLLCGYTPRYLRVLFHGPDELRGRIVSVRATKASADGLIAAARPEKA
jgi:threonylcarbamoyladenosine tRNA methylthiotransferase MtaB